MKIINYEKILSDKKLLLLNYDGAWVAHPGSIKPIKIINIY